MLVLGWRQTAMSSPKEGFLTDEQREVLKIASQNAEILSSSPRSPTGLALLLPEHNNNKTGRPVAAGNSVRHVRRSHSGKVVRVKKGELASSKFLVLLCR